MTDLRAPYSNPHPVSDPGVFTVLVVDDEPLSRRMMAANLKRAGFFVECCASGNEALEWIETRTPDLIVLDYEMPGLNGAEVCERIRSSLDPEIKDLPVILVTAHSSEIYEIACLEAGANDFLPKPVSWPVLKVRIEIQLRLRRYARELEEWREAHQADLISARITQETFMPATIPAVSGWEISAHYKPLIEVGGDIYGWKSIGKNQWAFWIADITGHGVAAALTTALASHLFNQAAENHRSSAKILAQVNRDFSDRVGGAAFMTACCVTLEADGKMIISNAGHPPVLIRRHNGRVESINPNKTILGLGNHPEFEASTVQLHPGDLALLYTDGLYALNSPKNKRFSPEIVAEALMEPRSQKRLEYLKERIASQSDGTAVDDDLTMIMLKRNDR